MTVFEEIDTSVSVPVETVSSGSPVEADAKSVFNAFASSESDHCSTEDDVEGGGGRKRKDRGEEPDDGEENANQKTIAKIARNMMMRSPSVLSAASTMTVPSISPVLALGASVTSAVLSCDTNKQVQDLSAKVTETAQTLKSNGNDLKRLKKSADEVGKRATNLSGDFENLSAKATDLLENVEKFQTETAQNFEKIEKNMNTRFNALMNPIGALGTKIDGMDKKTGCSP